MGLMGVVAFTVWYKWRKNQYEKGKEINEKLKPIWMNLKLSIKLRWLKIIYYPNKSLDN
jgi:hypothetical protein